jgi:hypothetical protein
MAPVSATAKKISWSVVLPSMMLAAMAALIHLDRVWMRGASYWDDMPVTTAWGLITLLNGPAIFVTNWAPWPTRVFAVGAFWACLGILLDRRVRGNRAPIIQNKALRILLFLLGFSVASLVALSALHSVWFQGFDVRRFVDVLLRGGVMRTLMGRTVQLFAGLVWGLGYTAYFALKLWDVITIHRQLKADG